LYHKNIISDDAIFIADSHYNKNRKELELLLNQILSNKIKTSQVFFMGDMFDFLSYEVNYFSKINQNMINLINKLSNKIEIIYFEGNHDFDIQKLFLNIKVIPRENQYSQFKFNNHNVYLAHGDIYTPIIYNIFTKMLRNRYFLKLLNTLDINNFISKYFEKKLINKSICHDFDSFEEFSKTRIKSYDIDDNDLIIEGHYHQGNIFKNYINIPSLACKNQYMQIINNNFEIKEL